MFLSREANSVAVAVQSLWSIHIAWRGGISAICSPGLLREFVLGAILRAGPAQPLAQPSGRIVTLGCAVWLCSVKRPGLLLFGNEFVLHSFS
jgi:hypothetical protein